MTRREKLFANLDHFEPCPISQMAPHMGRPNTVCDVLRRIFHMTDDEEIKLLARIATTMTKKMDYRLAEYAERSERDNSGEK